MKYLILLALFAYGCCPKLVQQPVIIARTDTTITLASINAQAITAPCNELPVMQPVYLRDTTSNTIISYWRDKYNRLHFKTEHTPKPITVQKHKEQIPVHVPCPEPAPFPIEWLLYAFLGGAVAGFILPKLFFK